MISRREERQQRQQNRGLLVFKHLVYRRAVEPDKKSANRVSVLRHDLAPYEEAHQYRHQRNRQQSRRGHGERLGIRERLKGPSFLRFKGKYWHERDRDYQQREIERGPDLFQIGSTSE